ncbi:MAG: phage protease [Billgrantia sp.]
MTTTTRFHIAACAARLRSPSREIQLMPAGSFRARDGRPEGLPHWTLNAAAAAQVIARAAARQTPFVIDYEHQTLGADTSGQPAPAAAWFSALEWREGDGLYAIDVEWTPRAAGYIEADEYRYLSPVFTYDRETGEVRELLMAAVTNNPAIDGIADLAAARFSLSGADDDTHEEDAPVNEALRKLLGLEEGASEEQIEQAVAALTARLARLDEQETELAALRSQSGKPDPAKYVPVEAVSQLRDQVAALSSKIQEGEGRELDRLIDQADADGVLSTPALKDWARELGKKDIAALRSYLETAAPIAALSGQQSGGKAPEGGGDGKRLSDEELAVCRQLGIPHDEYVSLKEAN